MTVLGQAEGAFGIRAEGRDAGIIFKTVAEAVSGARLLVEYGYLRVEVFERTSGAVLTRLGARDRSAA